MLEAVGESRGGDAHPSRDPRQPAPHEPSPRGTWGHVTEQPGVPFALLGAFPGEIKGGDGEKSGMHHEGLQKASAAVVVRDRITRVAAPAHGHQIEREQSAKGDDEDERTIHGAPPEPVHNR
jgi:hypothetical protein